MNDAELKKQQAKQKRELDSRWNQDRAQQQWATVRHDRYQLAQVAEHMFTEGIKLPAEAAEGLDIDRRQFGRILKRQPVAKGQPHIWKVLLNDAPFRQAILKAGDDGPTEEEQDRIQRWVDEHPAKPED